MVWQGEISESHVHVARSKFPPLERYLSDMESLGISRAVISQNIGNFDNEYLVDSARNHSDRLRAILMFDYENNESVSLIRNYSDIPEVVGARLFAETGSNSIEPLAIWRAIYENNWVASVRGPLSAIRSDHFQAILREFPKLKVRIEHLGSFLYDKDGEDEFQTLLGLSDFPNVYLMWGGFFANSNEKYPYLDTQSYLYRLLRAYGSDRIMWTGDWNANVSEGDAQMCRSSIDLFTSRILLPDIGDEELTDLMSRTLSRFLSW